MAANEPEAQTLKSWKDAFRGPIAGSRHLEQQLRNDVSANKDRLRTLVGASYRSLLETAGQIVDMHHRIQIAESHLGTVGQNCNTRAIDHAKLRVSQEHDASSSQRREKRTFGGQIALLENCRSLASKLVKQKKSLALAAKLLTIARLSHKTLSQELSMIPALETWRSRIASLRRHLLDRVDAYFTSTHTTMEELVDAMLAFCLVTNSSSTEVLKHFQHKRLEKIRRQGMQSKAARGAISAIRLWIETLRMSKDLLSRRLLESFGALRKRPMIEDPELSSLDGWNIHLLQRWMAPEVQNFTPWIKTVNLSNEETRNILETWSLDAFTEVLKVLEHDLDASDDVAAILALRNDLLTIWLPVRKSTPSHSEFQILGDLRGVLNKGLETQLQKQIESLREIETHFQFLVDHDIGRNASPKKLWDHKFARSSLDGGAKNFIKQLVERHTGHSKQTQEILDILAKWINLIRENQKRLDDLKSVRWIDIVEEEDDDMVLKDFEQQLYQDDPEVFTQIQKAGIDQALGQFQTFFVKKMESGEQHSPLQLIIRLIRDVCDLLKAAFPLSDLSMLRSMIPSLQEQLADTLVPAITSSDHRRNPNRNLWDGNPPMPAMPSPATIKLLRNLVKTMGEDGQDLWTATAVDILKVKTWESVLQKYLLSSGNDANGAPITNGIHGVSPNLPDAQFVNGTIEGHDESLVNAKDLQESFDVHYLKTALTPQLRTSHSASNYNDGLAKHCAKLMIDAQLSARLEEKATAYWNRTRLLFGPLSS